MLALTHAATGAALGSQVESVGMAFFLGVMLHLFLDKVPHFWPNEKSKKRTIMITDGILSALFIIGLYFIGSDNKWNMIAGALGGVIVDVLLVLTPLYYKKIGQWHSKRQLHRIKLSYYLTDIALIIISLYVIWVNV